MSMKTTYKTIQEIAPQSVNILSYLHANKWLVRQTNIMHSVGFPTIRQTRYYLEQLVDSGYVTTESGKQYKITDKGEELLISYFGDSIKEQKGTIG